MDRRRLPGGEIEMSQTMTRLYSIFAVACIVASPIWGAAQAAETSAGLAQVQMTDIEVGTGKEAVSGTQVQVHYTGWTLDGKKFDSSLDRNSPFEFYLGAGSVIQGWDIGVAGMRVGGKRELVIPSKFGYGERGAPPRIPPNATLKFEVALLNVMEPSYTNVGNDALKDLLARGVPIVDLRRQDEWKQTGVINGSTLITAFNGRGQFQPAFGDAFEKLVGPQDEVILICRTGSRTMAMSRHLSDKMGYAKVYNVQNGITKWIADGNPVVKP